MSKMKASELRNLIREEVRRALKEVGDSSAGAYPVNGLSAVISTLKRDIAKGEKSTYTGAVEDHAAGEITFTTNDGVKKEIYVGLNYNKKNNGYTMEVFVSNPDATIDGSGSFLSQKGTNLYKLMATVAAVCKKVTDSIQEINELKFESYPQWSREDAPDDTTAMKFILKYVKQAYGNISVKNYYGDIYVKLLDRVS